MSAVASVFFGASAVDVDASVSSAVKNPKLYKGDEAQKQGSGKFAAMMVDYGMDPVNAYNITSSVMGPGQRKANKLFKSFKDALKTDSLEIPDTVVWNIVTKSLNDAGTTDPLTENLVEELMNAGLGFTKEIATAVIGSELERNRNKIIPESAIESVMETYKVDRPSALSILRRNGADVLPPAAKRLVQATRPVYNSGAPTPVTVLKSGQKIHTPVSKPGGPSVMDDNSMRDI